MLFPSRTYIRSFHLANVSHIYIYCLCDHADKVQYTKESSQDFDRGFQALCVGEFWRGEDGFCRRDHLLGREMCR